LAAGEVRLRLPGVVLGTEALPSDAVPCVLGLGVALPANLKVGSALHRLLAQDGLHLVFYLSFRLGVAFDRVGIVLQILWSGLLAIFGGRSVVVVAVLLLI